MAKARTTGTSEPKKARTGKTPTEDSSQRDVTGRLDQAGGSPPSGAPGFTGRDTRELAADTGHATGSRDRAPEANGERQARSSQRTAERITERTKTQYEPTPEEIGRRAYEIYLERGGQHGRDDEDWYQAERELREKRAS